MTATQQPDPYQLLDEGIRAVIDTDAFRAYLQLVSRLHRYSWNNCVLIWSQRPDASIIAGYRAWQALGRQVRKGERGIRILAPIVTRRKADPDDPDSKTVAGPATRFRGAAVFDVSQTEGEDLPAPPAAVEPAGDSAAAAALVERLSAWLAAQGVTVEEEATGNGVRGTYNPKAKRITLHPDLSGDSRAKTLIHEAAHHVHQRTPEQTAHDRETVAESVAFVVCHAHSIDTSEYTFPYVAGWAQDPAVLKRNMAAVQKTAHELLTALEAE